MTQNQKVYTSLSKGLLTEANPLNSPPDNTSEELNCAITDRGGIGPRFGYSNLSNVTTHSTLSTIPFSGHENVFNFFVWDSPGEDSSEKFCVIQQRHLLSFYDVSEFNKIRPQFTLIDLTDFLINGQTSITKSVELFQGKGALFVCSEELESFYVSYDPFTRRFSTTQLDIRIRDFDQFTVDNELDDEPTNPSEEFIYNLKNQGWVPAISAAGDPIELYRDVFSRYPSLSMQWWVSKRFDTDPPDVQRFSPNGLRAEFFGNAQAPKGHYIYSAFNLNRGEKSGLDVENVRKNFRNKCGCFAFGRAFWSDGQLIYFSQTIESNLDTSAKCFQAGDPTAEYINEIVDTDGGVISIIEANDIVKMQPIKNGIIVFAANGVWAIQGGDGDVFKPSSYRVYQVTSDGLIGNNAVTLVNDIPVWASEHSVNILSQNEVSGRFEAQSMTEQTIKRFYISDILNKTSIRLYYDRLDDKLYLLYNNSTDDTLDLDKALVFEEGWHPWEFDSTIEDGGQSIIGAFVTDQTGIVKNQEAVTSNGEVVTSNGITVTSQGRKTVTNITTSITFINLNAANEIRFGRFQNSDYLDYETEPYDVRVKTSNLIDITLSEEKNAKYLTAYFQENQGRDACKVRAYWDFTNSRVVEEVTPDEEAYRSSGINKTVNRRRIQIPGSGEFLVFEFEGTPGKGFELLGFTVDWETTRRK